MEKNRLGSDGYSGVSHRIAIKVGMDDGGSKEHGEQEGHVEGNVRRSSICLW